MSDVLWGSRWDDAGPTPNDRLYRVLHPLAGLLVMISLLGAFALRPWDRHMGAGPAGRALTAKVHNRGIYTCRPLENDGTVPMDDVDYVCNARNKPILSGYWIGTDGDSITHVLPNGQDDRSPDPLRG